MRQLKFWEPRTEEQLHPFTVKVVRFLSRGVIAYGVFFGGLFAIAMVLALGELLFGPPAETSVVASAPAADEPKHFEGESEHCGHLTGDQLKDWGGGLAFCREPLAEPGDIISVAVTGSADSEPNFEIKVGSELANGLVGNYPHSQPLIQVWQTRALAVTKVLGPFHPRLVVMADYEIKDEKFVVGGDYADMQFIWASPTDITWEPATLIDFGKTDLYGNPLQ